MRCEEPVEHLCEEEKELIRRQDPWHRLYLNRTLSNYYKTLNFDASERAADRLDFHLQAHYDHFLEFNAPFSKVVYRPEEHCCIGRFFVKDDPVEKTENQPVPSHLLYVSTYQRRDLIDNVKVAIDRPHLIHTNAGYSRKPDGGVFRI